MAGKATLSGGRKYGKIGLADLNHSITHIRITATSYIGAFIYQISYTMGDLLCVPVWATRTQLAPVLRNGDFIIFYRFAQDGYVKLTNIITKSGRFAAA